MKLIRAIIILLIVLIYENANVICNLLNGQTKNAAFNGPDNLCVRRNSKNCKEFCAKLGYSDGYCVGRELPEPGKGRKFIKDWSRGCTCLKCDSKKCKEHCNNRPSKDKKGFCNRNGDLCQCEGCTVDADNTFSETKLLNYL